MGDRKTYLTNQIVRYSLKLDQKGFGANHDGNISVKFDDMLLATPTSVSKGDAVPELIITLDMDGNKIEGIGKPFSEIKLHIAAYRARGDIAAVVHAHPPFATARGLAGEPIRPALPEAIVSIGDVIPVTDYAMPGAPENDDIIARAVGEANAFMMQGNGVLAVGKDIEQAYLRLELVEHLAKIDFFARQMGKPFELPAADIVKLNEKRAAAGLDPAAEKREKASASKQGPAASDPLRELIASEVRKMLNP